MGIELQDKILQGFCVRSYLIVERTTLLLPLYYRNT